MKDYFCKLVDAAPKQAANFIEKFENVRAQKRAYQDSVLQFDQAHKEFFFHLTDYIDFAPLFWERYSPDPKRQRKDAWLLFLSFNNDNICHYFVWYFVDLSI